MSMLLVFYLPLLPAIMDRSSASNAISTGASLASSGAKASFRGHIANDTLGKTLAAAPPRRGAIFLVGVRPPVPHPLAPALNAMHTLCTFSFVDDVTYSRN